MSGKRFQARAKTVQKLGRDGLVEQNMATGEEKRVSQRTADISFGPSRTTEQAAGHRAAQLGGSDPAAPARKRRKQPRPVQQTAEEAVYAAQAPASAPEIPVPDAPSMRMAADAPMMAAPTVSEDPPPPLPASRRRRRRNDRKKSKQRQAAKHTPNAARSLDGQPAPMRSAGDAPMQNRPLGKGQKPPAKRPPRPVEGGGRLKFKAAEGEQPPADGKAPADTRAKMKKRQTRRLAPDAAQPAAEQRPSRPMDDGGGRLRFEGTAEDAAPDPDSEQSTEAKRAAKKRQVMEYAANAARSEDGQQTETSVSTDGETDTRQRDSPQPDPKAPELSSVPDDRGAYKKRQR